MKNETPEERDKVCENNCPDFNGMTILHTEQCNCSCHPVLYKGELTPPEEEREQRKAIYIARATSHFDSEEIRKEAEEKWEKANPLSLIDELLK